MKNCENFKKEKMKILELFKKKIFTLKIKQLKEIY